MKFIKIFLVTLVVLVVILGALIYSLLFTDTGNGILKPIIEKKAGEASGVDVKLNKFYLRFNYIDVEAVVLQSVKAKAAGGLDLLNQSFDINYSVNADKLPQIGDIKIDEPLSLNGQAAGELKNININGSGDIFGAAFDFNVILKDYNPVSINIDTNRLKLAKVLTLLGQPAYADGTLSSTIHINPNEKNELSGDAVLHVDNGVIYKNTLKKEFNVTLKEDASYKTSASFKLSNSQDLVGTLDFISSLANLKATDISVNINTLSSSGKYKLDIPSLKPFEDIAGTALQGAVSFYGNAKYEVGKIQADVNSDNLAGGKLAVKLDGDKLDASLTDVKTAEILNILMKPSYADASLNVKAKFSSLEKQTGTVDIDLVNGLVNSAVMKKEFNIMLPKTDFSAKSNITVKQNHVDFSMKFLSTLINIEKFNGNFDIVKSELKSTYLADIKDLSKFNDITGQKLKGSIAVDGEADYQNEAAKVIGKSDILGGNVNFNFENNIAKIDGTNLSTLELSNMLSYPHVFDAKIKLAADYDVDTSKGNFNAVSPTGHITKTQLGDLVQTFTNFDITADAYENMTLKGTIDSGKIKFSFDAKNKKVSLNVPAGSIEGTALNIPFNMQIEKTDIAGKVTGATDKPKVSIDSSKYLEEKATKEINRFLEKNSDKIDKALDKLFK